MEIEAKITGVDELEKALNELAAPKFEKKIITKALRQGAKIVLKAARDNVPRRTGTLRRSLGIISDRQLVSGVKTIRVGARATPRWRGYHGHLVEFGVPSRGIPARPFLRKATQDKFEEFLREYINWLDKGVTETVKKYAR